MTHDKVKAQEFVHEFEQLLAEYNGSVEYAPGIECCARSPEMLLLMGDEIVAVAEGTKLDHDSITYAEDYI